MRPRTLARVVGLLLLLGLLLALQGLYSHLTKLQREDRAGSVDREPRVIYEMPELEKALRRQAEERARQRREEQERQRAPAPTTVPEVEEPGEEQEISPEEEDGVEEKAGT